LFKCEKQLQRFIYARARLSTSNSPSVNAILVFAQRLVYDVDAQCRNLAFHDLTPADITPPPGLPRLLGLGLKFRPTPKSLSVTDLTQYLSVFHRQIRLTCLFGRSNASQSTYSNVPRRLYIHNRAFTPPKAPPWIEAILEDQEPNLQRMLQNVPRRRKYNLSAILRASLNILRARSEFMVVLSDKNLGPTLMLRDQYINFCLQHLSTSTYQRVHAIPVPGMLAVVRRFHAKLLKAAPIRSKEFKIIVHDIQDKRTNRFYALVKLHKSPIGLRPIISNAGCYLQGLSIWLDVQLQPYVQSRTSYIKNSNAFLLKLSRCQSVDVQMFTFDAMALYTSIPIDKGIEAVAHFTKHDPLHDLILEGLKIVMNWNFFTFGDLCYKQLTGTAMGSPVAPSFANLYLAYYEETQILPQFRDNLPLYTRYIDDVFLLWKSVRPYDFSRFRAMLRRIPGISWTYEEHFDTAAYLDLNIFRHEHRFCTRTHEKQLNLHLYVPYRSAHPSGNVKGLIFSFVARYLRQNTHLSDAKQCMQRLFVHLLHRGYRAQVLKGLFHQALQKALHQKSENEATTRSQLFLQVPFDPNGLTTLQIRNAFHLDSLETHLRLFGVDDVRICYRKAPNLRDLLCSSSVSPHSPTPAALLSTYHDEILPSLQKKPRLQSSSAGAP